MSKYMETPCGVVEVPSFARERVEKMTDDEIRAYLSEKHRFVDPFIIAEAQCRHII